METTRTWIERSYADATGRILVGQPGPRRRCAGSRRVDPGLRPGPRRAGPPAPPRRAGGGGGAPPGAGRQGRRRAASRRERSHVEVLAAVIEGRPRRGPQAACGAPRPVPPGRPAGAGGGRAADLGGQRRPPPGPAGLPARPGAPLRRRTGGSGGTTPSTWPSGGHPEQARRLARLALGRNPRHAGAAHALAHALFETGDAGAGARLPAVLAARVLPPGGGAQPPHLAPGPVRAGPGARGGGDDRLPAGARPRRPAPRGACRTAPRSSGGASWQRPGRPLPWGPVRDLAARAGLPAGQRLPGRAPGAGLRRGRRRGGDGAPPAPPARPGRRGRRRRRRGRPAPGPGPGRLRPGGLPRGRRGAWRGPPGRCPAWGAATPSGPSSGPPWPRPAGAPPGAPGATPGAPRAGGATRRTLPPRRARLSKGGGQ